MRIIPSGEINGRMRNWVPTSRNSTLCVAVVSVTVVLTYPNWPPISTSARCLFSTSTRGEAMTLVSPMVSSALMNAPKLESR